jgi:predicted nucleic acid-binding protein
MLQSFQEIIIPETVLDELAEVEIPPSINKIKYSEKEAQKENNYELDPGETAAITIAKKEDAVLLTDDLEAREKAKEINVKTHGSIGMIAMNQQKDKISFQTAIDKMRKLQEKSALFITDQIIEKAIQQLEENR